MDTLFRNTNYNDFCQLAAAFCLGILFSPWSWGLVYFISFLLIYEILAAYYTWCEAPYWRWTTRLGVLFFSVLGFFVGRLIVGHKDIMTSSDRNFTQQVKSLVGIKIHPLDESDEETH